MNGYDGLKDWLERIRFARNVCMLIPMEACMGYPIAVRPGAEFLLPFFKMPSVDSQGELMPPFAYLRIRYPSGRILTYNDLRTLPAWKNMDWQEKVKKSCGPDGRKMEAYFLGIGEPGSDPEALDGLLMGALAESPLAAWYEKLVEEGKKYR